MLPLNYESINVRMNRINPSIIVRNSQLTSFFEEMLYERLYSVIDITCKETIDIPFIKFCLIAGGYFGIFKNNKFGTIAQYPTLTGIDIYYRPAYATYTNPLILNTSEYRIGKDCALIHMRPDYCGCFDIISYYAYKLAMTAEAMDMSLFNSKVAFILASRTKGGAETLKVVFDKISRGEPAVAVNPESWKRSETDPDEPWVQFNQDVSKTFIADRLLLAFERILDEFDTEVGIPSANTEKKERMNVAEVNVNNIESVTRLTTWIDTMQEDAKVANKLFPDLNLKIKIRKFEQEERMIPYDE